MLSALMSLFIFSLYKSYRDLYDFPGQAFPDIQSERQWKMEAFCKKASLRDSVDPVFHIILTIDKVLSAAECEWIISEVDKAGDEQGWLQKRNAPDITTGLDLRRVDSLHYFTMNLVYSYIIPTINRVTTAALCVSRHLT